MDLRWHELTMNASVINAEARWSALLFPHIHTPPSDSCLNTISQLSQHSLTVFQMDAGTALAALHLNESSTKKAAKKKLIESWAEPEQCLVWCLLFQTHQTRRSKSLRFGHLYRRRQARLLLWARLALTAYEDKAALCESNTPVALIPKRAWSQDARSRLLEQVFSVSQSSWP